jgi:hypothetical protein
MSTMYLKYSTWPPWRTQRDAVGVFLQRGAHDVLDAAVVAQVHDFRALRLDQPAHDVDRRIVAVEQAGRGNEAQRRRLGVRFAGGNVACCRAHRMTGMRGQRPIVPPLAEIPAKGRSRSS